jgi:molybdopterin biosynthesis enzyme
MIPASMAQTFFKVLAPQDALRLLLGIDPVGIERIPSVQGRARVLAEDLFSTVDLPHFHRAAVDG